MANIYQAPSGSPSTWVSWEIGACCAVSRRQTDVTIFHIVMARNCVAFVCSFSVFRFSRRLRRLRSAMRRHCSCHRLTLSPFGHLFICEKTKKKKAGEKVSTAFGSYRSTFGCFFFLVRLSSYLFLWPTIFRRLLIWSHWVMQCLLPCIWIMEMIMRSNRDLHLP